jgi:DNA-binding NarL/FixJ family response regulator
MVNCNPMATSSKNPQSPFTMSERKAITLVVEGRSRKDIARALAMSEQDVDSLVEALLGKIKNLA